MFQHSVLEAPITFVRDTMFTFADLVQNDATIRASSSAHINVQAGMTGGFLSIDDSASVSVAGTVTSTVEFVTYEPNGAKEGTLIIQDLAGFDAPIFGFGDRIILADMDSETFMEEDLGIDVFGQRLLRFEDADGDEIILRFLVSDDFEYDIHSFSYGDAGGGLELIL